MSKNSLVSSSTKNFKFYEEEKEIPLCSDLHKNNELGILDSPDYSHQIKRAQEGHVKSYKGNQMKVEKQRKGIAEIKSYEYGIKSPAASLYQKNRYEYPEIAKEENPKSQLMDYTE